MSRDGTDDGVAATPDSSTTRRPHYDQWGRRHRRLVVWSVVISLSVAGLGLLVNVLQGHFDLPIALLIVGVVLMAGSTWIRICRIGGESWNLVAKEVAAAGNALLTGAAVGLVLFLAQDRVEENRFVREQALEDDRIDREQELEESRVQRAEDLEDDRVERERELEDDTTASAIRRDNIRFVRETATQPGNQVKPFSALDLQKAELAALDLSHARLVGADLQGANLFSAKLNFADLTWAHLPQAVLIGAVLADCNLPWTDLSGADLRAADLTSANLLGADLTGANLAGATLTRVELPEVLYDSSTIWPEGFNPPPSR